MAAKKHKLRKYILPSLNLAVSILAVLVTIAIAYYSFHGKSKNLSVYLEEKSYLKSSGFPNFKPMQIYIEDKPVQNIVCLKIRFLNLGDNILIEDFSSSIKINFKNIIEILDARIVKQVPSDIGCAVDFSRRHVVVSKALINHNDSFTIEVFCSILAETSGYIENIGGRIKGLHEIQFHEGSSISINSGWFKWRFIVIIPILYLYFTIWRMTDAYNYRYEVPMELCMYVGLVMILFIWILEPIFSILDLK